METKRYGSDNTDLSEQACALHISLLSLLGPDVSQIMVAVNNDKSNMHMFTAT